MKYNKVAPFLLLFTFIFLISSPTYTETKKTSYYYVCLASFNVKQNAINLNNELKSACVESAIYSTCLNGKTFYRVYLNKPFTLKVEAYKAIERAEACPIIKKLNLTGLWVFTKEAEDNKEDISNIIEEKSNKVEKEGSVSASILPNKEENATEQLAEEEEKEATITEQQEVEEVESGQVKEEESNAIEEKEQEVAEETISEQVATTNTQEEKHTEIESKEEEGSRYTRLVIEAPAESQTEKYTVLFFSTSDLSSAKTVLEDAKEALPDASILKTYSEEAGFTFNIISGEFDSLMEADTAAASFTEKGFITATPASLASLNTLARTASNIATNEEVTIDRGLKTLPKYISRDLTTCLNNLIIPRGYLLDSCTITDFSLVTQELKTSLISDLSLHTLLSAPSVTAGVTASFFNPLTKKSLMLTCAIGLSQTFIAVSRLASLPPFHINDKDYKAAMTVDNEKVTLTATDNEASVLIIISSSTLSQEELLKIVNSFDSTNSILRQERFCRAILTLPSIPAILNPASFIYLTLSTVKEGTLGQRYSSIGSYLSSCPQVSSFFLFNNRDALITLFDLGSTYFAKKVNDIFTLSSAGDSPSSTENVLINERPALVSTNSSTNNLELSFSCLQYIIALDTPIGALSSEELQELAKKMEIY